MSQLEKNNPPSSCVFIALLAGFDLSQYKQVYDDKYYNGYNEHNIDILFQHKSDNRRFILLDIGLLFQTENLSWMNFTAFETDQDIPENELYKYTQYNSGNQFCYDKKTEGKKKQQWIHVYL